jgi:CxxC motif-containing protein (DUF1111 family)
MIHGEAIQVAILEAPGHTGVGKFGWKDQDPTILSFSGDAYPVRGGAEGRDNAFYLACSPDDVIGLASEIWRKAGVKPRTIRGRLQLEVIQ